MSEVESSEPSIDQSYVIYSIVTEREAEIIEKAANELELPFEVIARAGEEYTYTYDLGEYRGIVEEGKMYIGINHKGKIHKMTPLWERVRELEKELSV